MPGTCPHSAQEFEVGGKVGGRLRGARAIRGGTRVQAPEVAWLTCFVCHPDLRVQPFLQDLYDVVPGDLRQLPGVGEDTSSDGAHAV